jgi:hypothetical protein
MGGQQSAGGEAPEPEVARGREADHSLRRLKVDHSAVLAAAAALLGATIGAIVTVIVTGQQIDAQDRSAVREQRQAAYAEVLVSSDAYWAAILDYNEIADQPLPADLEKLETAQDAFRQDHAVVDLLAGDEVVGRAGALYDALREAVLVATDPARNEQAWDESVTNVVEHRSALIEAARDELN